MLCNGNAKNFEVQQNFEYPNMYMVIVSSVLLVSSDIHLEKSWKKCSAHVFSYKSKKCKLSVGLYMNRIAVNHLIGCMITCRLLSVYLPRPRPWETTLRVSFLLLLDV